MSTDETESHHVKKFNLYIHTSYVYHPFEVIVVKVSQKGQITIPKEVREQMGLHPGDEVEFYETGEGFVLRRKQSEVFPEDGIVADDPIAGSPDEVLDLTRGRLD